MDAVQKRLLKELRDAQREPNPQILSLGPVEDDELLKWRAVIAGSEDSIYAGETPTVLCWTWKEEREGPG